MMDPYVLYLLYAAAVTGFCVLLLRRDWRRQESDFFEPTEEQTALLRGGPGAVVETVIFRLYEQGSIEVKTDGPGKKLSIVLVPTQGVRLSKIEEASIHAFTGLQGKANSIKIIRRQIIASLIEMEEKMNKAGLWKIPARWKWGLSVFAPTLIVAGSLRFLEYYEGGLQWALALTVPLFAVMGRRIVMREMWGSTEKGKKLVERIRKERAVDPAPLWQVALYGTQALAGNPDYRLFCFMTRGIPYWAM